MTKKIDKVWGYEEEIVNTSEYCGKFLYLDKGKRSSLHFHKIKDETFYILSGKVLMELSNEVIVMEKGKSKRIKPFNCHRFSGLEDSIITEFSSHHEDSDSYRIEESGDVPKKIMKFYNT